MPLGKSPTCRAVGWMLALLLLALAAPAQAEGTPLPTVSRYKRKHARHQHNPNREISFATFNVQNLFRFRRKPLVLRHNADGTEIPRANYLPSSSKEYRTKVQRLAATIVNQLGTPDIVSLQEIENYKTKRRGEKHVLADLSAEIKKQTAGRGDVEYGFALSHGLSDRRGISNAFIYRKDRVVLEQADPSDPLLGARSPRDSQLNRTVANPKSLNASANDAIQTDGNGPLTLARPALVGKFKVYQKGVAKGGKSETLYVVNQHLKSQPQRFQERRRAQAGITAKLVKELVESDPRAKVIVAGDMNVDFNQRSHQKQLRTLQNLTPANPRTPTLLDNLTAKLGESERFSYTYRGRQHLLDWVLASPNLAKKVVEVRIPHENSLAGNDTERSSDHDPVLARFAAFGAR